MSQEASAPWRVYRPCFCKGHEGKDGRCWNCGGRGYQRLGRTLASFEVGERVIDVFTRAEWQVVKHARNGVSMLRSTLTGREIEMNAGANPRYISPEEAERPETWAQP